MKPPQPIAKQTASPGRLFVTLSTIIVLVLSLFIWRSINQWYEHVTLDNQRAQIRATLIPYGNALTSTIFHRFSLLDGLDAFVRTSQSNTDIRRDFSLFAGGLYAGKEDIRALQIFPVEGTVLVYPLKRNEAIVGRTLADLVGDERQNVRLDVQRALQTRQIAVSGPYKLRQGGMGMVARWAIYREDALLGLAVVVLDLPKLLETSGITGPHGDLLVGLRDSTGQVLAGSATVFTEDPVPHSVIFPDGQWQLAAIPLQGWQSSAGKLMRSFYWMGLLIVALLTTLTFLFVNRQVRLDFKVKERTAALAQSLANYEQANERLRESEEKFRHVFESANVGKSVTQLSGEISVNKAFAELLGYQRDELAEKSWQELTPPEDIKDVEAIVDPIIRGEKESVRFNKRYLHKNGSIIWADVSTVLRRGEAGTPLYFITTIIDISDLKRIEEDLLLSRELFSNAFHVGPAGMTVTRIADGTFLDVNDSFLNIFGFDREEVIGHTSLELNMLAPEERAKLIDRQLDSGGLNQTELLARSKSGKMVTILFSSRPMELNGELCHVTTMIDISDRKLVEEKLGKLNEELEERVRSRTAQLEEANRELESFTYSVSHDLRAPLRAVDGFTRILLEDYGSQLDAEGRRICSVITNSARDMGALIDDLLAFSRVGRAVMQTSSIDMTALANAVFAEITTDKERKRIDFVVSPLPEFAGDPSLMHQVWFNLLSNAVKFSSEKERAVLDVSAETGNDEIVYRIRDNGAGFNMQYVDKLFGVFQRLHSVSEFEGTGVGLAIVQRIISRHNGRVWAEGGVGKGATFYFAFRKET